jgi:hypothetical protein
VGHRMLIKLLITNIHICDRKWPRV